MFKEDPQERWALNQIGRLREDGTWEYYNQWLYGSLPSDDEITQEIAKVERIRNIGGTFQWEHHPSQVDLSVSESKRMKSAGSEGGERLEVNDDYEMLEKENREASLYNQLFFEWTHFRLEGEALYILVLIIAIINQIELNDNTKFNASVT